MTAALISECWKRLNLKQEQESDTTLIKVREFAIVLDDKKEETFFFSIMTFCTVTSNVRMMGWLNRSLYHPNIEVELCNWPMIDLSEAI